MVMFRFPFAARYCNRKFKDAANIHPASGLCRRRYRTGETQNMSAKIKPGSVRAGCHEQRTDPLLLWVRRSLRIISERRQLSVAGQLKSELCFRWQLLLLARKDLC